MFCLQGPLSVKHDTHVCVSGRLFFDVISTEISIVVQADYNQFPTPYQSLGARGHNNIPNVPGVVDSSTSSGLREREGPIVVYLGYRVRSRAGLAGIFWAWYIFDGIWFK